MANKFIEQAKHGARCYCGHLMESHKGFCFDCQECKCDKYDRLPFDFFQRCPDADNCNSIYFYPDDENEDIFHCHGCESSFEFDGCECFTDLRYANLGRLDNLGDY
jgi:hypothetical protein